MNCDSIARWYRLFEYLVFGRALERRRRRYMHRVLSAKRVLILGDGDGRFAAEFLSQSKDSRVVLVDLSPRMLALARRRIAKNPLHLRRVQFREGDVSGIQFDDCYDLIVSHFFLDCFETTDVLQIVERLKQAVTPDATWLISEFGLPIREPARSGAALLIKMMYFFFRLTTGLQVSKLPDYAAALSCGGFVRAEQSRAAGGLLVSEVWSALKLCEPADSSAAS
jgi:ubiquinone/menaquinone biosynthesis C-methylase UbiE